MIPTLAALLLAIFTLDPLSGYYLSRVQDIRVQEATNDGPIEGYAHWSPTYILLNLKYIWGRYDWTDEEKNIWAACTLVHEVHHIRLRSPGEEVPDLYRYVCLDRMGAPAWMKNIAYGLLANDQ